MGKSVSELPRKPGEDPFIVARGGFYRRWIQMIDDIEEFEAIVASLTSTNEDVWVPIWRAAGQKYEDQGDAAEAAGDFATARHRYLLAKTFYAIGRFPSEITPLKAEISAECARAYRKACAHLDPPLEVMDVVCEGQSFRAHFRAPKSDKPVPAVLIMCGADVFKEDRGWAAELALDAGLASLVMDAPGTGENPFPWAPESVKAWVAAVDALAARPEVDGSRIGAFGVSRGGYSVMQLAGTAPEKVGAVVAIAGHPFHNDPSPADMAAIVATRNERAKFRFGSADGKGWVPEWSEAQEREMANGWSLQSLGLVDRITMPVLMVNGDSDGLAPIRNIYFMLENGPVGTRSAKVYKGSGHCAFDHQPEWGPASFKWLAERLG